MRAFGFLCALFAGVCGWTLRAAAQSASGDASATGISRAFNPAISVNALFLGHGTVSGGESTEHNDDSETEEGHDHGSIGAGGLDVQEVELVFSSTIDTTLRGDFIFAMHGTEGFELEEGFVQTLSLPANLGLRAGKFYAPFGKQNALHAHAFPFIDAPMIHREAFGGEGFNEIGAELSALLPTRWFSEIRAAVGDGRNETLFVSDEPRDLSYAGRWMNFFDLSDNATIELGVSGAAGRSEAADSLSRAAGADLTFKWKQPGPERRTLVAQAEILRAEVGGADAFGGSAHAQFRAARRWWIQGGFDWMTPFESDESANRIRALIAFVPSEFSALRLQYSATRHLDEEMERRILFQWNLTLGSHPAHSY